MSEYDEHLISMAGGDGDVLDQLAALASLEDKAEHGTMRPEDRKELEHVLAMVREQRAALERVEAECAATDADSNEPLQTDLVQRIRAALTATEGAE